MRFRLKNPLKNKIKHFICYTIVFLGFSTISFASSIIRDAETESYIREILDEILIASDINPKSIKHFLIKDNSINAGAIHRNIIIYNGLIQSFDGYQPLQAVLAHEVGHLKGFHSITWSSQTNNTLAEALIYATSFVLVALAGSNSGNLDQLSAAVTSAAIISTDIATKRSKSNSRFAEREADFYAVQILKKINASPVGLIKVFEKFNENYNKLASDLYKEFYAYYSSHPFPEERLRFVLNQFKKFNYTPQVNEDLNKKHIRVSAKLAGMLDNYTMSYNSNFFNNRFDKAYYKAFLLIKKGKIEEAESAFLKLLQQEPENPYILEVLSEINYKLKKYQKSLNFINKALKIKPNTFLFLVTKSTIYTAMGKYLESIKILHQAGKIEQYNPYVPFQIAKNYSRNGQEDIAQLYYLETLMLSNQNKKAKALLKKFESKQYTLPKHFEGKLKDIKYFLTKK